MANAAPVKYRLNAPHSARTTRGSFLDPSRQDKQRRARGSEQQLLRRASSNIFCPFPINRETGKNLNQIKANAC
jgi:hypothetical protein